MSVQGNATGNAFPAVPWPQYRGRRLSYLASAGSIWWDWTVQFLWRVVSVNHPRWELQKKLQFLKQIIAFFNQVLSPLLSGYFGWAPPPTKAKLQINNYVKFFVTTIRNKLYLNNCIGKAFRHGRFLHPQNSDALFLLADRNCRFWNRSPSHTQNNLNFSYAQRIKKKWC